MYKDDNAEGRKEKCVRECSRWGKEVQRIGRERGREDINNTRGRDDTSM